MGFKSVFGFRPEQIGSFTTLAAIVRSQNSQQKIKKYLKQLCICILCKAGAKHRNADLIKQANTITDQFETYSKHVKQQLRLILRIPQSATESETNKMKKDKIKFG